MRKFLLFSDFSIFNWLNEPVNMSNSEQVNSEHVKNRNRSNFTYLENTNPVFLMRIDKLGQSVVTFKVCVRKITFCHILKNHMCKIGSL